MSAVQIGPAPTGAVVIRAAMAEIIEAVRAHLPPDGISVESFVNRVIAAADNARIVDAMQEQPAIAATGKQQVGEVQELDVEQLKNLVSSVHRTVSLGHQRGPYAYSGEDFGRYLAEAARDCRQIMGFLDALAARQPAGQEPIGFTTCRNGKYSTGLFYSRQNAELFLHDIDGGGKPDHKAQVVPVYCAPPAQAVDLGQLSDHNIATLRDMREHMAAGTLSLNDWSGFGTAALDAVLALIDSGKAVQS